MFNSIVCADEENMEVVDCENGGTTCGADLAETCVDYLQDGEKSAQYVKGAKFCVRPSYNLTDFLFF